jgi:hypothetical protein
MRRAAPTPHLGMGGSAWVGRVWRALEADAMLLWQRLPLRFFAHTCRNVVSGWVLPPCPACSNNPTGFAVCCGLMLASKGIPFFV